MDIRLFSFLAYTIDLENFYFKFINIQFKITKLRQKEFKLRISGTQCLGIIYPVHAYIVTKSDMYF